MVDKKYCPFINGPCRNDCVFKTNGVAVRDTIYSCLIAIKLNDINEMQHDDLSEIWNLLRKN
jgi:hypothetical protein